ncbi:MAG: DUF4258 domain-containing protein [Chitinophagaceae bacterium]
MKAKKLLPILFLVVLALAALALKQCVSNKPVEPKRHRKETANNHPQPLAEQRGLNRNPSIINYSKHARCRMACRKISEDEVMDILQNGKINYKKSDLKAAVCKKRYAVEGISKDQQLLRIIFAPCQTEITVITCIDLGTDWECDCE